MYAIIDVVDLLPTLRSGREPKRSISAQVVYPYPEYSSVEG